MKSLNFQKQFLFQNKPNNDKLILFSLVKIVIPNQYQPTYIFPIWNYTSISKKIWWI